MKKLNRYKRDFLSFIERVSPSNKNEINLFFNHIENIETIVGLDAFNNSKSDVLLLDLSSQDLKELPSDFDKLKNVLALDISENKGIDLTNIGRLQNLQVLFIEDCELIVVPEELGLLNKIFALNLNENSISLLPDSIKNLHNLIGFNLSDNKFEEIPACIFDLPNIHGLYLSFNKLKYIPKEIFNISTLKDLSLANNGITNIEPFTTIKSGIENFSLSNNKINEFQWLCNLTSLSDLKLSRLELNQIPEEVITLINLKELDLSDNNISIIPPSIKNLVNLHSLNIGQNKINELPIEIGELYQLNILNLYSNKLDNLPSEISRLKNLTSISLSSNQFEQFPETLTNNYNIQKIDITFNRIESISENIGKLLDLKELDLSFNKIIKLPSTIGNCAKLKKLALDHNALIEYPLELANLKCINTLYSWQYHSNPLTLMPEAKSLGLLELFDYLNTKRGVQKYSAFWDIPDELKTGFQQYLAFFSDFVKKLSGYEINLTVQRINTGLQLITETNSELSISQIDTYLIKYLDLFLQQNENVIPREEEEKLSRQQLFEVRQLYRDLQYENQNLNRKIQDYVEKIIFLKDTIEERTKAFDAMWFSFSTFSNTQSRSLELSEANNNKGFNLTVNVINNPTPQLGEINHDIDYDKLLVDLMQKCIKIAEKKGVAKIEDIHNNDLAVYLREHHYFAYDQSQSGIGITGKNFGELDILIRASQGTPICIIEAFNLKSAGSNNKEISSHINKLIHKYDTIGHKTNFILVYALASNFKDLWANYISYVQDLNSKPEFEGKYPLISFTETGKSSKTNLKVGLAIHNREGEMVKIYHIFIDMHSKVNDGNMP